MSGRYDGARGQRYSPHASHPEHPPSSTLLLRGLAPSVDDEMILRMLQPFRPSQARTMFDKATGEPRGFAFVDFDRVESAMEAMRAFESRPLVLQHRQVTVSYTDSFRRRSPDGDIGRPRGGSVGSRHGEVHLDTGERWQPRPDWICDECNVTNFARRTSCFQCNALKTAQTKEVPVTTAFRAEQTRSHSESHRGDSGRAPSVSAPPAHDDSFKNGRRDESVPPSQVLMVRHLPPDIEEGELQVAFAEFDGVQDIRLIRDRATNSSRGFGFIEFRDIEAATQALKKCGDFVVQNTHVEVSYARDTLSTRSHFSADPFQGAPRAGNSMAVTALEQAQWSLSQGRGADAAKTDQNLVAADVSALLDSAAAEVMPHFEEPKKMWPQPFETAGGSYVYASEYGLYWDPDSMFYYDVQTKVYHNSFTGVYYRCVRSTESGAAAFQVFVPPVPVDATTFQEHTAKTSTANKPALSLSLKKDKKKASGISFGIKTTAFAPAAAFEKENQFKTVSTAAAAPAASAVSVASVGMKRKSADDIAKWSQRQREAKAQEHEGSSAASSQPRQIGDSAPVASATISSSQQKAAASAPSNATDSVIDALTSVPQEVPICLLCRRKFGSLEMLHKHEKLSKLHLANLATAKENKQHIAAQYREHEKEMERDAKKQRQEERAPSSTAPGISQWDAPAPAPTINPNPEPTTSSLESGIGGKMLKMMGWKSGEGLGKHGKGITAPIKAAGQGGRSDTAGLGSKAPLSASVDLSDATNDKERRQRLTRARYDADSA